MMEVYLFGSDQKLLEGGIIMPSQNISSWQKQALGGIVSHTFEAFYSPILDECAYFGMRDVDDDAIFWMYRVRKREKNGKVIRLDGIHKFYDDLAMRGYIEDIRPKNQTIAPTMLKILDGTGWEIGSNTVTQKAGTNIYYLTKVEAFNKAIAAWGCEYRLRMRFADGKIMSQQVDLAPAFAEDNGVAYECGDKLVSIVAKSNEDAIFTAICGRGKGEEVFDENGNSTGGYGRKINFKEIEWKKSNGDPVDKPLGQGYVEFPQATKAMGFPDGHPRLGLVDFPDIEDREELLKATYNVLLNSCRPKVEMKANVYENEIRHLGEKVWIIRDDIGIRYQTRIFEIDRSFLSDKKKEISFGDKLVMSRAEQRIRADIEEARKQDETLSRMDKITDSLQKVLLNDDGYNYELKAGNPYKLPAGYYSFDRPIDKNPTKVIYMGAGRLAIADSKKSDGTWNFRTFGTGAGFIADLIESGTLRANLVNAGVLSDQKGSNYWDMDNSIFSIGNGAIRYSPDDGLKIQLIDDLKKDVDKKADANNIITTINASQEGVVIAGKKVQITGETHIDNGVIDTAQIANGAITTAKIRDLSADKITGGTIDADSINVRNLNADNLTRGTVSRGVSNGSCYLPTSGSATLAGYGTSLNTGSSAFVFDYGTSTFEVQGSIAANRLGTRNSLEHNGLTITSDGGRVSLKPWGDYVKLEGSSTIRIPGRLQVMSRLDVESDVYAEALHVKNPKTGNYINVAEWLTT
ncbi:phage tail spike protein [Murdochiella massiliensis]|uniref:phage tail spike protein n=1 Tax=Murdochiella massiliensis TaxID=1673723 RepID=UPI0009ECCFC9|nr:phage tail spike protein [Murdochiella massiliensis]